jgi:hypothetical protein
MKPIKDKNIENKVLEQYGDGYRHKIKSVRLERISNIVNKYKNSSQLIIDAD